MFELLDEVERVMCQVGKHVEQQWCTVGEHTIPSKEGAAGVQPRPILSFVQVFEVHFTVFNASNCAAYDDKVADFLLSSN